MPAPPKLAVDLAAVLVVAAKSVAPTAIAPSVAANQPAQAKRYPAPLAGAKRPASRPPHWPSTRADARYTDTLAAQLLRGRALTLRTLYFEQGKTDLLAPVQESLDTLARVLNRYPTLAVEVQGHTDNQGDPVLNQQLSQQRAEAVCYYLTTRGVALSRLRPVGLGSSHPIADNTLLAQRPRNRRVVLRPLP